jgi:serine/threonine protein kinase
MAESVADASEVVLEDELLFDDPPRESSPRRDELVREGQVLAGKYRVERIPGRNGLGVLVQVRHMELGQEVTLKFLVPDACMYPEFVQRFIREARAAVKIQGEHVARVTDVGRLESGAPYMVREFLRGPDLSEVLKVRGPLPADEACDYIIQAAEAVAEAHVIGIAHRNLRPTTLVVTRRSDGAPLVKVFDFAAAEALHVEPFTQRSVSLVGSSALLASLPYLSPEQVRDPHGVDFRADVYALGAILYELLSGVPPFEAESAPALLAMVAADAPTPLYSLRPDLPDALEQAVMRCLAKSRDQRFSTIAELSLALGPFASAESAGSIERIARLARRTARPPSISDARISQAAIPVAAPVAAASWRVPVAPVAVAEQAPATVAPVTAPLPRTTQPIGSYGKVSASPSPRSTPPPLRPTTVPPPLYAHEAVASRPAFEPSAPAAQAADASPVPPAAAPSATNTTMMPPAQSRSSISWGLSNSWGAPPPERAPLPIRKMAIVGLVAGLGAFALVTSLRHTAAIGSSAAAAQPVPVAALGTQAAAAPVALPAVTPAPPVAETPAAVAAPAQPAPVQAALVATPAPAAAPAAPAPVAALVAPAPIAAATAAPAVPAARPVAAAPRAAFVAPAPRPARPAAAPVDEAPRAPAKVAAASRSKDLFSDPD